MGEADQGLLKSGRFEIRRRLGSGGFGEVYEAFDRDREDLVALKVLRRADATALYRFKQEFRTLANLTHRNLVTLYELISQGDQWLLTMELVHGVDFVDYVRPAESLPIGAGDSVRTLDPDAVTIASPVTDPSGRRLAGEDGSRLSGPLPLAALRLDRLRAALAQLAEGVCALHRNGILHLDIKPSNVLVGEDGRVVVVDFGLAEPLGPRGEALEQGLQIAGTPEYMSPEQAAAQPLTEASDWYCVGALLYRALTGLPTFSGEPSQVMYLKLDKEPIPAGELVAGLPMDLGTLCRDLLRRDPARRPRGADVLGRLGTQLEQAASAVQSAAAPSAPVFVGRAAHLAQLRAAFEEVTGGRHTAVHIHGQSGMGKSALIRNFLSGLRQAERGVVVLDGRCYENEAVPFKAFDSVLDALSSHLRTLSDSQVAALLPREVEVLARVFPVLGRVRAIASAHERTPEAADPGELRRRAFAALRDFFARLAEGHRVVLVIDDLQWGDVDSANLLDELLRPPDPPPLLLILCYRTDEGGASLCLETLLAAEESRGDSARARRVEVAELSPPEAAELARALLPGAAAGARADLIASDARGNPFFIDQLARHATSPGDKPETLETALWNRVAQLPDQCRRFMEVVAVAGRPVEMSVAAQAAEVTSGKLDLFASLRAERLIRSRARHGGTEVEAYHDRIRETIVAHVPPEALKGHHQRLALALEASNTLDLEALTLHFRSGGDLAKAAHYAVEAAGRSAEALAFAGAARLYGLAIELQPDSPQNARLQVKRGDALAMTGRVIESAEAYLAARDASDATERIDLQRRAGEQYLLGFHLDQGLALLRSLLADMGMTLPSTTPGAFVALVVRQIYLRMRGTSYRERPEEEVPTMELQRLDLCYAVCRGLGFTDSIRAIELQSRHLVLALNTGEPYRLARALAQSAAADGVRASSRPRAERLLRLAADLAERARSPHAVGIVHSATGLVHMAAGRWQPAITAFDQAERIFQERCITPPHTTVLCRVYRLDALFWRGELREYFRVIPQYFAECQGRGDVHAEGHLRMRLAHLRCFAEDDPIGAWDELRHAEDRWGDQNLQLGRAHLLFRQIELALYAGEARRAWDLVARRWAGLTPLQLFGFQSVMTLAFERRAYCALGMAAAMIGQHSSPDPFLKSAEQDARRIERWNAPWGVPVAHLIRAGIAAYRRDPELATSQLTVAEHGFREAGMALHVAVTRWRRGSLTGGDAGRTLVQESKDWLSFQGVKDADRMGAVIAPGRWTQA